MWCGRGCVHSSGGGTARQRLGRLFFSFFHFHFFYFHLLVSDDDFWEKRSQVVQSSTTSAHHHTPRLSHALVRVLDVAFYTGDIDLLVLMFHLSQVLKIHYNLINHPYHDQT